MAMSVMLPPEPPPWSPGPPVGGVESGGRGGEPALPEGGEGGDELAAGVGFPGITTGSELPVPPETGPEPLPFWAGFWPAAAGFLGVFSVSGMRFGTPFPGGKKVENRGQNRPVCGGGFGSVIVGKKGAKFTPLGKEKQAKFLGVFACF